MPRRILIATALLVGVSMLAVAAVVEFYSEDVRHHCLGPDCVIGKAYQKTWTKVWHDSSARRVVAHSGAAYFDSRGIYYYRIQVQAHPATAGCVGDRWSGYVWMRMDYDTLDWYAVGLHAFTWTTVSSIKVYAC